MAKIDRTQAYCPELGRIITIREAWDYTFGDKPLPHGVTQLTFRCPVKGCGAKLITRNFKPYSKIHGTLDSARFRLYLYELHVHPRKYLRK